jgi:hypothetical protein
MPRYQLTEQPDYALVRELAPYATRLRSFAEKTASRDVSPAAIPSSILEGSQYLQHR